MVELKVTKSSCWRVASWQLAQFHVQKSVCSVRWWWYSHYRRCSIWTLHDYFTYGFRYTLRMRVLEKNIEFSVSNTVRDVLFIWNYIIRE